MFYSKRSLIGLAVLASLFVQSSAHATTELQITTFNIRWFGVRYDDPRGPNPKPIDPKAIKARAEIVRDFLEKAVDPHDVITFEEVVDVNLLKSVLPTGWTCMSYSTPNKSHQHVAICASPKYQLLKVPYDNNSTIEAVATDPQWSRPAVRVDLADLKGNRLLRMVGVHFKAMPGFSRERIRQMGAIATDLSQGPKVPTIILGDMNTFETDETRLKQDDIELLGTALAQKDPTFTYLSHSVPYTFRSPQHRSQFDQMFVNNGVRVIKAPKVFAVCSATRNAASGYMNFDYYYKNVSDHCPVQVRVAVP